MFRTGRSKDPNVENGPFYRSKSLERAVLQIQMLRKGRSIYLGKLWHASITQHNKSAHITSTHTAHTQLTQHPDTRKAFRVRSSLARFRDRLSQPPLSLLRFVAAEGICKIQCSRRALPVFTLARPMGRDPSKASFCNSRCRRDRHRRRQGRRTHPLISRAQKV